MQGAPFDLNPGNKQIQQVEKVKGGGEERGHWKNKSAQREPPMQRPQGGMCVGGNIRISNPEHGVQPTRL